MGTAGQRQKALTQDGDVFLINRENVPWLIKYLGKGWFFDMLVIDELTSFKNRTTNVICKGTSEYSTQIFLYNNQ